MAEKSLRGSVKQASKSNSTSAWWSTCLTLVGVPQNMSWKTEAQSQQALGHRTCCWRALSRAAQPLGTARECRKLPGQNPEVCQTLADLSNYHPQPSPMRNRVTL